MARPRTDSRSYFPLDTDFFSDRKIKSLRANYGADGISLYIYCLCSIYDHSYYVQVDDDFIDCAAGDLGLTVEKTRQIMRYFCKRSLFDDKLFTAVNVLTAKSVQRRFQETFKGSKRDVFVDKELWLLESFETLGFIKVRPVDGFSEKNEDFSGKNYGNSENYSTKESKGKESKGKESRTAAPPASASLPDRNSLIQKYGEQNVARYEMKYLAWQQKNGISGAVSYPKLAEWLIADGVPENSGNSSIDLDGVMEDLRRQYTEGQNAD